MTERARKPKTGATISPVPFPKISKKKKVGMPSELCVRLMDALGLSADPESEQVKELLSKMTVSSNIKSAIRDEMLRRYPDVKKNIAKLIGEQFNFSEEELLKLIEFLESDIGKKFREKHSDFNDEMAKLLDEEAIAVMKSVTGLIQQEMNKAMLDKGCDYKYYMLPVKDWMGKRIKG